MTGILQGLIGSYKIASAVVITGAGYVSGGSPSGGGTATNAYKKLTYSNETVSTLTATLSAARETLGGFSNSGTAGYSFGGSSSGTVVDKLTFSTETNSTVTALPIANNDVRGAANQATAGYTLGGYKSAQPQAGPKGTIYKYAFPADTQSTLAATLTTTNYAQGTAQNKGAGLYSISGYNGSFITTTSKLSLPAETTANIAATITTGDWLGGSASNDGTAGYIAGGTQNLTAYVTTAWKLTFATDTFTTISNALSTALGRNAGMASKGNAGYFAGGSGVYGSNASDSATINKISFTTDTSSLLTAVLPQSLRNHAGFGNSGTY